jgi:hypothetical protein
MRTVRRHPFLVALALVAILTFAARLFSAHQAERAARRALTQLAAELEARARVAGSYPSTLDELGWRLPPIVGGTRAVDPWGRPLSYRTPGPGGAPYELRSLGPDGVPSGDDLAHH